MQGTQYLTHDFDLFRLPHPFTMRGPSRGRRPNHKEKTKDNELQQQVSLGQFRTTMDLIFRFGVQQTQFIKSNVIPSSKRVCIRFPPSGGQTTKTITKTTTGSKTDPIKAFFKTSFFFFFIVFYQFFFLFISLGAI